MNLLVILAHPRPGSFNHTIAQSIVNTLRSREQNVIFHDLYREKFEPILRSGEIDGHGVDPIIDRHCRELAAADGIIIVHPVWWEQPPAILKGWLDRVFQPGLAYDFTSGHGVGLLNAQFAMVFNTSSTPEETRRVVYGDPLKTLWGKSVFGFCGVKRFDYRMFPEIQNSTPGQRDMWLQEILDVLVNTVEASSGESLQSGDRVFL